LGWRRFCGEEEEGREERGRMRGRTLLLLEWGLDAAIMLREYERFSHEDIFAIPLGDLIVMPYLLLAKGLDKPTLNSTNVERVYPKGRGIPNKYTRLKRNLSWFFFFGPVIWVLYYHRYRTAKLVIRKVLSSSVHPNGGAVAEYF
jgi:hypothetical protein